MSIYYRLTDCRLLLQFIGIKFTFPIKSFDLIGLIDLQWNKILKKINRQNKKSDKILFFGDSIIEMSNVKLYIKDALNLGIYGETLSNAAKHLVKFDNFNDKKILFAYGINDVINGNKNDIIENYKKLIKHFSNCSKIFITSILPVNKVILLNLRNLNINNNEIFEINKSIENLCNESKNVFYIDTAKNMYDDALNLKEEYTGDGLHLNENGYEVFYANISDCFKL